jgi:hypothetical protein
MATTFTYFPLLPTEIRLQIWRTAQFPRIVKIHIDPDSRAPERPWDALTNLLAYESRHERPFYFKSLTPIPATLAVNQESREETLALYTAVCDDLSRRFYWNATIDTLWIEQHEYTDDWAILAKRIRKLSPGTLLKSVAIRDDGFHHRLQSPSFAVLVRDYGIQELFLVADGEKMPMVRPLVPRMQVYGPMDVFLQYEHGVIVQEFRDIEIQGGFKDTMPKLTVVEKGYWEKEGLQLRDHAEY